jgi:hypothetical protein
MGILPPEFREKAFIVKYDIPYIPLVMSRYYKLMVGLFLYHENVLNFVKHIFCLKLKHIVFSLHCVNVSYKQIFVTKI